MLGSRMLEKEQVTFFGNRLFTYYSIPKGKWLIMPMNNSMPGKMFEPIIDRMFCLLILMLC